MSRNTHRHKLTATAPGPRSIAQPSNLYWLLPPSISFSSSFSGHPKQSLCPPPCFGLRRAVSVAQARSSPHGPPRRARGLCLASGAVVVRFRKGFDGWTGDRLQFKLHEASILVGFGSPALRPISQVFVATAGAGMQQHQLPCILGCRNVRINNVRGAL